jgi:hypothetical protein
MSIGRLECLSCMNLLSSFACNPSNAATGAITKTSDA